MTFLSLTAVLELFKRARHIRHLVEDRRKHALLVKTLRQRNDSLTAELQSRKDESATMPSPQLRDRDETVAIRGRSSRFSQLQAIRGRSSRFSQLQAIRGRSSRFSRLQAIRGRSSRFSQLQAIWGRSSRFSQLQAIRGRSSRFSQLQEIGGG